jgi:WD40 repeat protein
MGWNGHGHGAWEDDQELDWIFPEEPELRETAHLLHRLPRREAPLDPAFRATLRRRLMQEAWDRAAPALPWWRRLLAPQPMAWAGATVGVLLIAFVVYALTFTPAKPDGTVIVSSPLQGAHAVAATKPIELQFSQPMDTSSVEDAVQIQPATKVKSYQWVNGNSTVEILPENGLAPNTQYQVTLSQKAKTQTGHPVVKRAVTFVTAPPPTPRAIPTPVPTPRPTAPPGITTPHLIAPSGTSSPSWSPDGSTLFVIDPNGQLRGFSVASGAAQPVVAADGVTLVTVGPDATPAYARNGQLVYGQTTVSAAQPLALGFQNSRLVALTGRQVQVAGASGINVGTGVPSLGEDASAADFSPNGRRLAYLGASGSLRVLDLTSGQDTVIGPATGLGAWSRDGARYAYLTADGVSVTNGSTPGGSNLVSLAGAASVSWSAANQLLLTTQSALLVANGDGSGLRSLASGTFTHATWSPAGDGSFWFKHPGSVWVASVSAPTSAAAATGPEDLVNQFMTARQQGDATLADSLLDANGRQAFSGLTLTYPGGGLSRWYVLLSQPHQVVVRMILARRAGAVLDEALTIVHNSIDGVTETPAVLSSGPNILNVKVTSTSVRVTFDSDLDPSTYGGGVTIDGVQSRVTYQPGNRSVIVTPEVPLTPGTTYQLSVNSSLRDVNHSPAASYQLTFTGAAS